jgi:hypothetical protein
MLCTCDESPIVAAVILVIHGIVEEVPAQQALQRDEAIGHESNWRSLTSLRQPAVV